MRMGMPLETGASLLFFSEVALSFLADLRSFFIFVSRGLSATQVAFLLVFLQYFVDLRVQCVIDDTQFGRYVFMYCAFADVELRRCFSDGGSLLYNVVPQALASFFAIKIFHNSLFSVL